MATFRYSACAASGRQVTGEINAIGVREARQVLEEQGFSSIHFPEHPEDEIRVVASGRLSSDDAEEWTEQLAQLGSASIPLAAGFRAAAIESSNPRVAKAMHSIAVEMEKGEALENVLQRASSTLPGHVAGLVTAAGQTGQLGHALSDLVEHQRTIRALKRRVWDGFAYPIVVGCMAGVLILVLLFWSSNPFERLFDEFQIQLPFMTKLLFWWRDVGIWLVAAAIEVMIVCGIVYRKVRGQAAWLRLVNTFPLFGPLGHWLGLAEWSRLLAVLLRHRIPLPQALRLSAEGVRRPNLQEFSIALAEGADRGQAISDLLAQSPEYPRAMVPIVRWGERSGLLAQAFELGSQMFELRVENRSAVLQSAVPPLLFIAIGSCVLLVAGGLFFPLGLLIRALSF